MAVSFGCQTYTWQMSYEKYKDEFTHILNVIQTSGFDGVEAEVSMLGSYYQDASLMKEALSARGLKLAALTLALPWQLPLETEEEQEETERLLRYLRHFPETKLILVQLPGSNQSNLEERQINGLRCVNTVAKRAKELCIVSAFHPNSPEGSVFRTAEDYRVMFEWLDTRYVGYCPDSGHIANGGMNVLEVFHSNFPIINHIHFKDISSKNQWRTMGKGVIAHKDIVRFLCDNNYDGWIMVEEESEQAKKDPDLATEENGRYVLESLTV